MTKPDLVVDTRLKVDKKRLPEQVDVKNLQGEVADSDDDEEYDEDDDDEDDDDDSDMTSSPSIPDENIDYDLVYTLHTFVATVEGQASVGKGSSLKLLDDTNSYWWLIKELSTDIVGYIPAENIETPYERLARLNKHRNVELASAECAVHHTEAAEPKKTKDKKAKCLTISSKVHVHIIPGEEGDDTESVCEEWTSMDEDGRPILESGKTDEPEKRKQMKQSMVSQTEPKNGQGQMNANLPSSGSSRKLSLLSPFWRNRTTKRQTKSPTEADEDSINSTTSTLSESKGTEESEMDVIPVYPGNTSDNVAFKVIRVKEGMKTEQLVAIAMDRFHIPSPSIQQISGVEYYLTFNTVPYRGHETALEPQMEILPMLRSLTDHLTTPMPAYTHQIHQMFKTSPSKSKDTHQLASKSIESFGRTSPIRFYLYKRIKRTGEKSHQVHLKISYFHKQDTSTSTHAFPSLLRRRATNEERIDKFVAVDINDTPTIKELRKVALEKFHLSRDGVDIEHDYQLTMGQTRSTNRLEHCLPLNQSLLELLQSVEAKESKDSYMHFFLHRSPSKDIPRGTNMSKVAPTMITPKNSLSMSNVSTLSIPSLDNQMQMVLTRLDRDLLANQLPSIELRETDVMSITRNADESVDIVLPNGLLQTKMLPNNQIQYTLLSSSRKLVMQLILPANQGPDAVSHVGDMVTLIQHGLSLLDQREAERMQENGQMNEGHELNTPPPSLDEAGKVM